MQLKRQKLKYPTSHNAPVAYPNCSHVASSDAAKLQLLLNSSCSSLKSKVTPQFCCCWQFTLVNVNAQVKRENCCPCASGNFWRVISNHVLSCPAISHLNCCCCYSSLGLAMGAKAPTAASDSIYIAFLLFVLIVDFVLRQWETMS